MPDQNQTTTPTVSDAPAPIIDAPAPAAPTATPATTAQPATAAPSTPAPDQPQTPDQEPTPEQLEADLQASQALMKDVASQINDAHNILIALSSDPSVDELSAAIGLSLYLDKLGKRATAIYSGTTPNALEFLKPADTFDSDTDVLQDFVIALNKDKADHLRYKLDGDYVKIFITPYKSRIAKDDLEFSYGDFNIDLVLSLNVANGTDLDSALREHGRIMHDATVINITTGNPGKFGEIEWSDKHASSICEMAANLLNGMSSKSPLESDEATALLTGIIAATDRFSNTKTTPDTMQLASKLMESGANQQLIAENISDMENNFFNLGSLSAEDKTNNDPTSLAIDHDAEEEGTIDDKTMEDQPAEKSPDPDEPSDLPDLSAVAASLSGSDIATPESPESSEPLGVPDPSSFTIPSSPLTPSAEFMSEVAKTQEPAPEPQSEKVLTPPENFAADTPSETGKKYSQMLADALKEETPTITNPADAAPAITGPASIPEPTPILNPAASVAPAVPTAPEINGVPEINYNALDADEALPPPPAPPIDPNSPIPPASSSFQIPNSE